MHLLGTIFNHRIIHIWYASGSLWQQNGFQYGIDSKSNTVPMFSVVKKQSGQFV